MVEVMVFFVMSGVLMVVLAYGWWRRVAETAKLRAALDAARTPSRVETYHSGELVGLPEPVQRYFRAVLTEGQRMVRAVDLMQEGTMNMSADGENWKPFGAKQRVVTERAGFDWEAWMMMAVDIHDAYIAGEGILRVTLLGLIPLASLRGTPEMAQGELLRFFAEAAWYPTRLLPSQGVVWKAVDEWSAEATLRDGPVEAKLLFRFGADGSIETARAEARGRSVGKTVAPTPWEGRWSRWERREGMLIPLEGEVAWILPEGAKTYWRGRITKIAYDFVG